MPSRVLTPKSAEPMSYFSMPSRAINCCVRPSCQTPVITRHIDHHLDHPPPHEFPLALAPLIPAQEFVRSGRHFGLQVHGISLTRWLRAWHHLAESPAPPSDRSARHRARGRRSRLRALRASGIVMRTMSAIEARPPEAITGIETASASAIVASQLMPASTPSRSMSV